MNTKNIGKLGLFITLALSAGLIMAACGGGGNTPGSASLTTSGIITGFGSIWVNGVEYETDNADFIINGVSGGSQADLKIKMKVKVRGQRNSDGVSGTAFEVEYDDELKGPIASPITDNGDGTKDLRILGQRAVISQTGTNFDDDDDTTFSYGTVAAGNVVEASGFWKTDTGGNEYLEVTHIELKATDMASYGDELEIKGEIKNLDTTDPNNKTFEINGLTIDFTNASVEDLEHAPDGQLEDGLLVEVKGDSYDEATNTLTANKVEVEEHGLGRDIDKAEVEGYIDTGSLTDTMFSIGGQSINFENVREWEHGSAADLSEGTRVETEGPIDSNGVMQAYEIEFEGMDDDGSSSDDGNGTS